MCQPVGLLALGTDQPGRALRAPPPSCPLLTVNTNTTWNLEPGTYCLTAGADKWTRSDTQAGLALGLFH